MARWLGVVVSGNGLVAVDAEVPNNGEIEIVGDFTWPLQGGDRGKAYNVMQQRVANYAGEHGIVRIVVKESALTRGGVKKAHLLSAELRGAVIAACASVVNDTHVLAKAKISKMFGDRKVDEYLADNDFWTEQVTGEPLRVGSREAAMILLAARKLK